MEECKKNFKLLDCILAVICVVLTVEAVAPAATIGNNQFFWWIFMLIFFCIPYSLISAELGTTYKSEGGLCNWISRAYGEKVGSRVSLYYWINFPLWTASVAILITDNIPYIFNVNLNFFTENLIRLAFIWVLYIFSFSNVSENKLLFNISTILKIIIFLILGVGGIYVSLTSGVQNNITMKSLVPVLDIHGLSFISIIIFNFMGFEVITTYVNAMPNPKKDIPKAVFLGGISVTALYLLATFGISVAIPTSEISHSMGVLEAINLLFPDVGSGFILIIGVMLLFSMFSNQLSWSFGINYVANYSAINNGGLPEIFKQRNKKGLPTGVALMNGVVSTTIIILIAFIELEEIFWSIFALNLVMLLLSYVLLFPAFLKLRKIDFNIERPYKVFGGNKFIKFFAYTPMLILINSIFFTIIPLSKDDISEKIIVLAGTVILLLVVELVIFYQNKNQEVFECQR